jgi:outer membrane biosynthesis protein TonB
MMGFFTAVTKAVSPEAMKKALPGLVPDRFLDLNIRAFEKGYDHGIKILEEEKRKSKKKAAPKKAAKPKAKPKAKPAAKPAAKPKSSPKAKPKAKKK